MNYSAFIRKPKSFAAFLLGMNLCLSAFAADPNSILRELFTNPKYAALCTASKEFYLSEDEKQVIALINLARYDSKTFIKEIVISSGYDTSLPEVSKLISYLKTRKSIFPLMPAFSLYKAALSHAKDMGISGLSGHTGSDGKNFHTRIQQHFQSNTGFAENFYLGNGNPVDVVMSFLLEKGENGAAYKNTLLDEKIHYIGISIQPHRHQCNNAVLDFARKPIIPAATAASQKKHAVEVYWKDCPTGTKVASRNKSRRFSFSKIFGGKRK